MDSGYIVYVVDTETTGADWDNPHQIIHEVIEVSFSRFSMNAPELAEQKTWFLKALKPDVIQERALTINKHKREDILHMTKFGRETYKEPSDVVAEIEMWITDDDMSSHDRIILGQNIMFDVRMLKSLWGSVGASETFPFNLENDNRIIDTKQLAIIWDLCTGRRRRYYNLSTLVQAFGVKKRKAHRAEDDTAMTAELFLNMITPIRPIIEKSFRENYSKLDM